MGKCDRAFQPHASGDGKVIDARLPISVTAVTYRRDRLGSFRVSDEACPR